MPRAPFQVLVIPYRRSAAGMQVAVMHRADYPVWQFVSGGGEIGETEVSETIEAAARREGFEEAGIPAGAAYLRLDAIAAIPACWFAAWASWPEPTLVVVEHAFAVDVGDHPIAASAEHDDVRWVHYDAAIALLGFDSNRVALWELHERLYPAPRGKRAAFAASHRPCACTPDP